MIDSAAPLADGRRVSGKRAEMARATILHRTRGVVEAMQLDIGGDAAEYTERWLDTFLHRGGVAGGVGLGYYHWWQGTCDDPRANSDNIGIQVFLVGHLARRVRVLLVGRPSHLTKCRFPERNKDGMIYLKTLWNLLYVFYWGSHWVQPWKWTKNLAIRCLSFIQIGRYGYPRYPCPFWKLEQLAQERILNIKRC